MDTAALVFSVLGCALSIVSIVITIKLTKRTSELRTEIKKKLNDDLAFAHFNESKHNYLKTINDVKGCMLLSIEQEISLSSLDDLLLVIKRIRLDISRLNGSQINEAKKNIDDLENLLSNTEFDSQTKNTMILTYLRDLITFLEFYKNID